jgi:hypothetical protein
LVIESTSAVCPRPFGRFIAYNGPVVGSEFFVGRPKIPVSDSQLILELALVTEQPLELFAKLGVRRLVCFELLIGRPNISPC